MNKMAIIVENMYIHKYIDVIAGSFSSRPISRAALKLAGSQIAKKIKPSRIATGICVLKINIPFCKTAAGKK